MGLVIRAMNNIVECDQQEIKNDEYDVKIIKIPEFRHQFGDLKHGYYKCDFYGIDFQVPYSEWSKIRENLCEIIGIPKMQKIEYANDYDQQYFSKHPRQATVFVSGSIDGYDDYPLLSLINFSDCEGFICHEICIDIAEDFKVLELPKELNDLKKIFYWAADNNGIVQFN